MTLPDEETPEDAASTIKKEISKPVYNGLEKMVMAVKGTMKNDIKIIQS